MSDVVNIIKGLSTLLFTGVILGAVFVAVEGFKTLDEEKLSNYNAYDGKVGDHHRHELRRNMYYQLSVIAALIAIYIKLPSSRDIN